jgi:hypothetical protein
MSELLLLGHHATMTRRYIRGEEDAALPTLLPSLTDCAPEALVPGSKQDLSVPGTQRGRTGAVLLAPCGRVGAMLCGWMCGRGSVVWVASWLRSGGQMR